MSWFYGNVRDIFYNNKLPNFYLRIAVTLQRKEPTINFVNFPSSTKRVKFSQIAIRMYHLASYILCILFRFERKEQMHQKDTPTICTQLIVFEIYL